MEDPVPSTTPQAEVLFDFIDKILDEKQLDGMTDEVRAALREDLANNLLDQIDRALINALPEDKVEGLNQLLDQESTTEADVQKYITDADVDAQRVSALTMVKFRDLYLGADSNSKVGGE